MAAGLALSGALLAGCMDKSPDQYLAGAKAELAKQNNGAALIQLKNALQGNPSMAEARFLLGKTSLQVGDVRAALIELEKARELGYPAEELVPELARAMLASQQWDKLLQAYGSTQLASPAATADLKASLAVAYGSLKQTAQAAEAIKAAMAADPSSVRVQMIRIRHMASTGSMGEALRGVSELLAKSPKDSEIWELKGDLLLHSGKPEDALAAYREAAALNQNNEAAQIGVMTLLLAKKDLAGAATQLATLKSLKIRPEPVVMFTGLLALETGDLKQARESAQLMLKAAPDDVRVLNLAGMVEYRRGAMLEADNFLSKVLQASPDSAETRLLLAQIKLRQGEPAKTLALLQPLLGAQPARVEAYGIAAEAYLQTGEPKRAEEAFAKASQLNPRDVRSRVALALMDVSKGRVAEGVSALRAIAASDPSPLSDTTLVTTLLQRQDWGQALEAVGRLEAKTPNQPTAPFLRGGINLARGNNDQARKDFEAALKIDPAFFPAAQRLAAMDLEQKQYDAARARFKDILATQPDNVPANLALVAINSQAGAGKEELVKMLDRLIKQAPADAQPRMALIEVQLQHKDYKAANATAQEAVAALPKSPDLWRLLGQVQALSGDANQALASMNTWASVAPDSPEPFLAIAQIYAKQGKRAAQVQSIKRGLSLKPDHLPAQLALFAAELGQGHAVEARRIAESIQVQRPTESIGHALAGDLNARQRNWSAAAANYRAGLKLQPLSDLAVKLHQALVAGGKGAEAAAFEAEWSAAHPQDAGFVNYLGDQALARRDSVQAEQRYLAILKTQPDNAAAANNLAWLLHETKRPGALAYAERATRIAPDRPEFLDTLAAIHADAGQFDKALVAQKRAVALAPDFAAHRLHLARYYVAAGQKAEARKELTALAALGGQFAEQAEVTRLLSAL